MAESEGTTSANRKKVLTCLLNAETCKYPDVSITFNDDFYKLASQTMDEYLQFLIQKSQIVADSEKQRLENNKTKRKKCVKKRKQTTNCNKNTANSNNNNSNNNQLIQLNNNHKISNGNTLNTNDQPSQITEINTEKNNNQQTTNDKDDNNKQNICKNTMIKSQHIETALSQNNIWLFLPRKNQHNQSQYKPIPLNPIFYKN